MPCSPLTIALEPPALVCQAFLCSFQAVIICFAGHTSCAKIFVLRIAGNIRSFEKGTEAILCFRALLAWSTGHRGRTGGRETQ